MCVFICIYICMYILLLPKVHSPNHATDLTARWLKRHGLSQGSALRASIFLNFTSWGSFPPKPPKFCLQCKNPSQIEKLNSWNRQKVSQNTNMTLGTFFQNLHSIFTGGAWWRFRYDITSGQQ